MVNSVGIPSRGVDGYLISQPPLYQELGVPVIVRVGGHRAREYAPVVQVLRGAGDAYELNVSCPNLDRHGTDIGSDPDVIGEVVRSVRRETDKTLIVKLAVFASSIADSVRAVQVGTASFERPFAMVEITRALQARRLAAELGAEWGVPVRVSLEARMACGLGYCHGCAAPVATDPTVEGPLVCVDGPVVDAVLPDRAAAGRGKPAD